VKSKQCRTPPPPPVPLAICGAWRSSSTFGMTPLRPAGAAAHPLAESGAGFRDLDDCSHPGESGAVRSPWIPMPPRVCAVFGFSFRHRHPRLLDELTRHAPRLLAEVAVVDSTRWSTPEGPRGPLRQPRAEVIYGEHQPSVTPGPTPRRHPRGSMRLSTVPRQHAQGTSNENCPPAARFEPWALNPAPA